MAPAKNWFEHLWSKERRRAGRLASIPLVAYYWDGATPVPHQVRDISPEGMYLLTEQRWYANTLVTMTLTRSDKPEAESDRSITLTTRVVRSGTDGVGMAFVLPRSRTARERESSFYQQVDRKALNEFLERLQTDTGRNFVKTPLPATPAPL